MKEINIGIIDDKKFKAQQLRQTIKLFFKKEEFDKELKDYKITASVLELKRTIEAVINEIRENNIDVLIIDYNLSSGVNISYNGVELAEYIKKTLDEFPVFILTGVIQDLYDDESFPASFVYNSVDYEEQISIRRLINEKLVRECLMYRKRTEQLEGELTRLSKRFGESIQVDNDIISLQNKLAKRCFNNSKIPFNFVNVEVLGKLSIINEKLDEMIRRVEDEESTTG